mmetsp:Transcript_46470/g.108879  ORF Transcript_46470/g.108879 Transcript_46470/m.108879 type:complete len:259 (-) Transcript_46470:373-1149(-)
MPFQCATTGSRLPSPQSLCPPPGWTRALERPPLPLPPPPHTRKPPTGREAQSLAPPARALDHHPSSGPPAPSWPDSRQWQRAAPPRSQNRPKSGERSPPSQFGPPPKGPCPARRAPAAPARPPCGGDPGGCRAEGSRARSPTRRSRPRPRPPHPPHPPRLPSPLSSPSRPSPSPLSPLCHLPTEAKATGRSPGALVHVALASSPIPAVARPTHWRPLNCLAVPTILGGTVRQAQLALWAPIPLRALRRRQTAGRALAA